ncbi:hypothetical protein ACTFIY_008721 [Dictyostelium cf. discoideum]
MCLLKNPKRSSASLAFLGSEENKKSLYKLEFLEDGVNSTQNTGSYHGYVGANKLVLYKKSTIDINLNSDSPNIPNDLDSYTSSLYINNDKKVIYQSANLLMTTIHVNTNSTMKWNNHQ